MGEVNRQTHIKTSNINICTYSISTRRRRHTSRAPDTLGGHYDGVFIDAVGEGPRPQDFVQALPFTPAFPCVALNRPHFPTHRSSSSRAMTAHAINDSKHYLQDSTKAKVFKTYRTLKSDLCEERLISILRNFKLVDGAEIMTREGVTDVNKRCLKPVALRSGVLSSTERAYSATKRELLAIIDAVRTFFGHIQGTGAVTVLTDHRVLKSRLSRESKAHETIGQWSAGSHGQRRTT